MRHAHSKLRGSEGVTSLVRGAIAVLVALVAIFMAYNANQGLPFVPTQTMFVDLPNADGLLKNNDIRVGGRRIGFVAGVRPYRQRDGVVVARFELRLDDQGEALPADSTFAVRPLSTLGLKYMEVTPGRTRHRLRDGAVIPIEQTRLPTDFDEFFSMFDRPTRRAVGDNQVGFGNALAGRGEALNRAITAAPAFADQLDAVMRNLADPRARLRQLFPQVGRAMHVLAPVSGAMARTFSGMADTFEAFAANRPALRETVVRWPGTLEAGNRALRRSRPMLRNLAAFSTRLETAADELSRTLPPVNVTLAIASPVARRSVPLSTNLTGAMRELDRLARAPTTSGALRGLVATIEAVLPQLRYIGPYLTVCNYWNAFFTLFASDVTEPDPTGYAYRVGHITDSAKGDDLGSFSANEFVHGVVQQPNAVPQYLHQDKSLAPAVTPDGDADCFQGQTGYSAHGARALADQKTYGRVVVVRSPRHGPAGPTYKTFDEHGHGHGLNPARVPPGQTFSTLPPISQKTP